MKIGFIGTGTMGQPMLANLIKKGCEVIAFDIVPAALEAAVRLGAKQADSVREAAAIGDLVIVRGQAYLPSPTFARAVRGHGQSSQCG